MKTAKLIESERRIVEADGKGILERWKWGRALLGDPKAVNPAGTLTRGLGTAEKLIAVAKAKGLSLSLSEIQYRLHCARTYPTEELTSSAAGLYGSWRALCDAGFPLVEVATPAAAPDRPAPPEPGTFDELFPAAFTVDGAIRPLALTPLRTMLAYADEMEQMTANFARRDVARRARVNELIDAAGGDLDVTYGAASSLRETGDADQ